MSLEYYCLLLSFALFGKSLIIFFFLKETTDNESGR